MYVINKSLEDITEADLQYLIDEERIEKKVLEYKSELSGNGDSDKKEFLADVSSFANAIGGDIIYGIIENRKTGKPKKLEGIEFDNVDQEILRLDHIIRDGIEPNIPSSALNIKEIQLKNSKYILIIRINRSWINPHRISFKAWDRFYTRSTNGKYRFDVQELRSAFIFSETIGEKIREFRVKRISDIYANNLPIPFYESPKIALHLIPISAFNPRHNYDLRQLSLYDIQPIYSTNFNKRYNIDGLLTYSSFRGKERSYSYVQLYRNGIIEAVNSCLFWSGVEDKIIPITAVEKELIEAVPRYIEVYKKFNIEIPVFLFLTLIDVKDYVIPTDSKWWIREVFPINRDIIQIPEIIIEDFEFNPPELLKPIFDSIWNACGFEESFNYTKEGELEKNKILCVELNKR